jgi:hypothetical protein
VDNDLNSTLLLNSHRHREPRFGVVSLLRLSLSGMGTATIRRRALRC